MMSIMLLALVIGNYKLENNLRASEKVIAEQKLELVNLDIRNKLLEDANIAAFTQSKKDAKVIEKKVVEIKKVYVPQIEYIDRYVGDRNETNCKSVDGIITGFIY